jgi:tellurite resistance protein TehA-like permease
LVRSSGQVVNVNYTTGGWVHIIVGCIVAAAGVGVLDGRIWARVIGVGVAFVSALISLGFLSAYPIWAILMIALAVVVIMALTVHGSAIKRDV